MSEEEVNTTTSRLARWGCLRIQRNTSVPQHPIENTNRQKTPPQAKKAPPIPSPWETEVLRWIRKQPHLANLLVVVLTSSSDINDVNEAYDCGARSFLVKPLSVERRLDMFE